MTYFNHPITTQGKYIHTIQTYASKALRKETLHMCILAALTARTARLERLQHMEMRHEIGPAPLEVLPLVHRRPQPVLLIHKQRFAASSSLLTN